MHIIIIFYYNETVAKWSVYGWDVLEDPGSSPASRYTRWQISIIEWIKIIYTLSWRPNIKPDFSQTLGVAKMSSWGIMKRNNMTPL